MSRVFPRCRTLFCPPAGCLSGLTILMRTAVMEAAWYSPHYWSESIAHTRQREDQPLRLTPGHTQSPVFNHAARTTGPKLSLLLAVCSAYRIGPVTTPATPYPYPLPRRNRFGPKGCPRLMSGAQTRGDTISRLTLHHPPQQLRGNLFKHYSTLRAKQSKSHSPKAEKAADFSSAPSAIALS